MDLIHLTNTADVPTSGDVLVSRAVGRGRSRHSLYKA